MKQIFYKDELEVGKEYVILFRKDANYSFHKAIATYRNASDALFEMWLPNEKEPYKLNGRQVDLCYWSLE